VSRGNQVAMTPKTQSAKSKTTSQPVAPTAEYQEHHFSGAHDVGVAWNSNRVWVCLDGIALLRAKMMGQRLFIEYYPPRSNENEIP
jgi:hypothetical protein